MYHNPDNPRHCNHAIDHGQNDASLMDRFDKYILIENESENLARTSRIYHLLTVQKSEDKKKNGYLMPANVNDIGLEQIVSAHS